MGTTIGKGDTEWTPLRLSSELKSRLKKWGVVPEKRNRKPYRAKVAQVKAVDAMCLTLKLWSGAPRLKKCFDKLSRYGLHDLAMLCGPIGAHLIDRLKLKDPKYTELFIDILFVLDNIWHKQEKTDDLPKIHLEMTRVFTRAEYMLPKFWSTGALHYLAAHSFSEIGAVAQMGVASETHMLASERVNVVISKLTKSRKGEMTGLARQYRLMEEAQFNRLEHPELYPYPAKASSAVSIMTLEDADYDKPGNQIGHGKRTRGARDIGTYGDTLYDNLIHFWGKREPDFADLLQKYRAAVRARDRPRVPLYLWEPPMDIALSARQHRMRRLDRAVVEHHRMTIDGCSFRGPQANAGKATDDGNVACTYSTPRGATRTAYGTIKAIYEHNMYLDEHGDAAVGSPSMTLVHVEWKEPVTKVLPSGRSVLDTDWSGRVAIVRTNPDYAFNVDYPFEDAARLEPYNVEFWDRDEANPDCVDLRCISRDPRRSYLPKR
jgi:hypothetical protein